MTDQFSIAPGCIGLVASITTLSLKLHDVGGSVKGAASQMTSVKTELENLTRVLLQIQDIPNEVLLPITISKSLGKILQNCATTLRAAETKYQALKRSRLRPLQWVRSGKKDTVDLLRQIEAYKSTVTTTLIFAAAIKNHSADSAKTVLKAINTLRRQRPDVERSDSLRRYLEDTASYAETIVRGSADFERGRPFQIPKYRVHVPTPSPQSRKVDAYESGDF